MSLMKGTRQVQMKVREKEARDQAREAKTISVSKVLRARFLTPLNERRKKSELGWEVVVSEEPFAGCRQIGNEF